jgi:hypothetical protein
LLAFVKHVCEEHPDFSLLEMPDSGSKLDKSVTADFIFRNDLYLDFGVAINVDESYAIIAIPEASFIRGNEKLFLATMVFLKLFCYEFLPFYAFGPAGPGDWPPHKEFHTGDIDTIYTFNYWDSQIISFLGREKILSLDVWELEQAGEDILVIIENPSQYDPANRNSRHKTAANALGLKLPS